MGLAILITLVEYSLFPVIWAYTRSAVISKSKYSWICYGVNLAINLVLHVLISSSAAGFYSAAFLLWTTVFVALGVSILRKRNLIEGEQTKKEPESNIRPTIISSASATTQTNEVVSKEGLAEQPEEKQPSPAPVPQPEIKQPSPASVPQSEIKQPSPVSTPSETPKQSVVDSHNKRQENERAASDEVVFVDEKTYIQGNLPVAVSNVRILKNQKTGQLALTFDITSSSDNKISAIIASADCFTVWGDSLGKEQFQVLDLKVEKNTTIESVASVILQNNEVRRAKIRIDKIAYFNGDIQIRESNVIESDIPYLEHLRIEAEEEKTMDDNQRRMKIYRTFSSDEDVDRFAKSLYALDNVYEVSKKIRDVSVKYPDLFSEEFFTRIKKIERKQAVGRGDVKNEAVGAIIDYFRELKEAAEKENAGKDNLEEW